MINGNTDGVRRAYIDELEGLYELKLSPKEFASPELLDTMARLTELLNREISVFLSRNGAVLDVSIGSFDNVTLPSIRKRRATQGLSGARCIHTHPAGSSMLSEVDIGTLISSRMDAMSAVAVREGRAVSLTVGIIGDALDDCRLYGPFRPEKLPGEALMGEIAAATLRVNELIRLSATDDEAERAILIGINLDEKDLDELEGLSKTAGAVCVGRAVQNRERDKSFYIGRGKAREIALMASALNADTAIFDDELTPIEAKNLEDILGLKVVDRTALILDIFASRAKTREGRLQVELAQCKYNLPRLTGEGLLLSRLGGGIGTRGPGEKKIEVDRRRLRRRIFELTREIKELTAQRELRRKTREKNRSREIALAGYTNAGKSSLLNALCQSEAFACDMLFATLDPVTRKARLASGEEVLFTDTVGFIEKLPHDLVDAFRSTLEEATRADLIVHVADASNPACKEQMQVVNEVLSELGAGGKPCIVVYNKIDLLSPAERAELPTDGKSHVSISAATGEGLPALLSAIEEMLIPPHMRVRATIPYSRGDLMALVKKHGRSLTEEYTGDGMSFEAELPVEVAERVLSGALRD